MKHLLLAICLLTSANLFAEMPKGGICAHQGDNAAFPANTVPAFKSAAEKGAAMVEMDVKRCATGELVIMHDSTVARTTNGTGEIAKLTFERIRALDAGVKKNLKFAGTKVPTFDEAIDCLPKDGIWINVHCSDNVADEVARKIKEKGRLHQAFIATTLDAIERARKIVPEILSCNMNRTGKRNVAWTREQSTLYATQTVDHRCNFLQLITPCSSSDVKLLHGAGAKISFFGCNEPAKLQELLDLGVDFILTDRLDVIQAKYKALKGNQSVPRAERRGDSRRAPPWGRYPPYSQSPVRAKQCRRIPMFRLPQSVASCSARPPLSRPFRASVFVGSAFPGRRCALPWAGLSRSLRGDIRLA